jgi:beta-galactosidase
MQTLAIPRPIHLILFLTLACTGCINQPLTNTARKDTVLSTGWRFIRHDVADAQSLSLNDTDWQTITLPQTWNAQDGQDGGNNYYRGPGWYRLNLDVNPDDADKQLLLRFDAASLAADVYVNSQFAGHHAGGFSAFCFDITHLAHQGGNTIAVRVDNSPNPDIPPDSGDFTICGGLYRDVHLLVLRKIHVSATDDASPGVYLTPTDVSDELANIDVRSVLRNDSDTDQTVQVRCKLWDMSNHCLASRESSQTIPAHADADTSGSLSIEHPHLWNGNATNRAYLYHVTVDVMQRGTLLDRVIQPLGLRAFRVDAQKGFILNNRPYSLHGVAVHQDFFNKGWAESPEDIQQSYNLIEEMGANTVRLAHYQHPEAEYSLCDRDGIVVWAEACLVNRIHDTPGFAETAKQQLRELIKQNYNHPSIFFWSLFNELGPRTRTNWQLVHDLNQIAHDLDPTRITVAASHLPAWVPLNTYPDAIAFNRYFGWYTGITADWASQLDKIRATLPNSAVGISEYGAGASARQHENPTTQPSTKGHWHPEEWQMVAHESAWRAIEQRPWLWATYVWCMFDFASDARNEGDTPGQNDKGLVTADRQTRKDTFYFYKANWTSDPFVHICEQRYSPRPPGPIQIKVYSNCQTVELFLNDKSQGKRSSSNHVFVWNQVPLAAGKCDVRAVSEHGSDQCTWSIEPSATTHPISRPTYVPNPD